MEQQSESEPKYVFKKEFHRSNKKRVLHTLCLVGPVVFAFLGWFISTPLWTLLTKKTAAPELFKFACAAVLFIIAGLIVFIATRKANPVMKISLTDAPEPADL